MKQKYYYLMDGRAIIDFDKSLVLEVCESLQEAYENWKDYGADTCIVDEESEVVDCLLWNTQKFKAID